MRNVIGKFLLASPADDKGLLGIEIFQELEQALRGLARPFQQNDGGAIGGAFLSAGERQQVPDNRHLPAARHRRRRAGVAGKHADHRAKYVRQQRRRLSVAQHNVEAGEMTSGDVAGFMGQNTDELTGALRGGQQFRRQKYTLALGHERIGRIGAHDVDSHGIRFQSRRPEHWRGVEADGIFDFGVEYLRLALGIGRPARRNQERRNCGRENDAKS